MQQDPDKTIADPQGYSAQGQPSGQPPQPPYGQPQGQFPRQPQPSQGPYNAVPGQFSAYPSQQPGPLAPQPPSLQRKLGLLWVAVTVAVLLVVGLVLLVVLTRTSGLSTSTQSASTQSTPTNKSASAQSTAAQSASGTKASANSGAQSSASSGNNTTQAQATAVATASTQGQAQTNNAPNQTQLIAQAGPPAEVAKNFFTAIQKQDYNTAFQYTSFKALSSATFHNTSTTSDLTLGKLTSYTIGKTTISPSTQTIKAQVIVSITRANIPTHNGLASLVLENGTWKITDGTVWQ